MKLNQAIEKLIENPKDVYECFFGNRYELFVSDMGFFRLKVFDGNNELDSKTGAGGFTGNLTANSNWQLKRQPIPWQEAIQAWLDGKSILVERGKETKHQPRTFKFGCTTNENGFEHRDFTEGKWYIE